MSDERMTRMQNDESESKWYDENEADVTYDKIQ